jgi:hypothetical protein
VSFEQNSKVRFTAVRYNISKGKYDEQKAKATKTKNTIRHSNNSSIHSHFLFIVGLWVYRAFIPLVDCVIFLFVVLANSSVNGVVVNHPITGNNTAELVVMQYDAEKGKYTMISKMIY